MTFRKPFTLGDRRCSLPDCRAFHYAKGLCKKHYMKQAKADKKTEEDHEYSIRKLYGTLKDKGFIGKELTETVVILAKKKGQWTIGRCTTEQINELYDEVNSGKNIMEYLKSK